VGFEFGPARETIETGNFELRVSERFGFACLKQVPGLVLEMSEIGIVGKLARYFVGIDRHERTPFLETPVVRIAG